jgi:UDP-hydrolysing UDP-N-acetyl-D-glucosamine 2-epimerase
MTRARQPRRIGIFTSGRQDVGYLLPVARAVREHSGLELTVFLSGTHLLECYGATGRAFRDAGFACVDVPMIADAATWDGQIGPGPLAMLSASLSAALAAHPVDVMVLLGDRIETLQAAVLAVADRRFVAHIHAGDRAPGEFDDGNRHAISKLAHVHFAATAGAAERLIRMGESPSRIHQVGSPGIDSILAETLPDEAAARCAVGLPGEGAFVVILHHPCGQEEAQERADAEAICQAVADSGLRAICLEPNSDPHRQIVLGVLRHFSRQLNWPILPNIERRIFLRLMGSAVALVGNSSAGMIESAAVVLNVGRRQQGREHSANVIHVAADRQVIGRWLIRLEEEPALAGTYRRAACIYGDGRSSRRIAEVLLAMELSAARRVKLNEY